MSCDGISVHPGPTTVTLTSPECNLSQQSDVKIIRENSMQEIRRAARLNPIYRHRIHAIEKSLTYSWIYDGKLKRGEYMQDDFDLPNCIFFLRKDFLPLCVRLFFGVANAVIHQGIGKPLKKWIMPAVSLKASRGNEPYRIILYLMDNIRGCVRCQLRYKIFKNECKYLFPKGAFND